MGFISLLYGVVAYVFFLATFVYAIGFVGNLCVPKTIDSGAAASRSPRRCSSTLLLLGALRRAAQRDGAALVQALVDAASCRRRSSAAPTCSPRRSALALLLWQWRPIAEPVDLAGREPGGVQALWAVFWLGWAVLLLATFLINHFELFGLRQVFARLIGREIPAAEFRTPFLYRYVRHPIYLGFLLGFWAAPVMTAGHLLFAVGATGYILVGIWFEERDLIAQFGEQYRRYREQVGMLIPSRKTR